MKKLERALAVDGVGTDEPLDAAAVAEAVRSWRLECRRMGADYHLFTTDTPLGTVLGEYLEKRSRLG